MRAGPWLTESILGVFDHLPDVYFFVKDTRGRIVAANMKFVRRMGRHRLQDVLGTTAYDFCPRALADEYTRDDRQVMRSRKPVIDRVELNQRPGGGLDWLLTTKLPMLGRDGTVRSVIGVSRNLRAADGLLYPCNLFEHALRYIERHFGESIRISNLAEQAHMSLSQFERKFKALFQVSAREYLMRFRVQKACEFLVSSHESVGRIAALAGFYDQASFTRLFRARIGMTPARYRALHAPRA